MSFALKKEGKLRNLTEIYAIEINLLSSIETLFYPRTILTKCVQKVISNFIDDFNAYKILISFIA